MSAASLMFSHKSPGYVKRYLTLHPDATKDDLSPCEYGHPHCAQYKKGPCSVELAKLIEEKGAH